jgi:hypothetical protein
MKKLFDTMLNRIKHLDQIQKVSRANLYFSF